MSGEICISVERIGISYSNRLSLRRQPPFVALKEVTFDIYKGEALGIIGRNGAGKSSLLRAIAGTLKPNQGKIINYGYSVSLLAIALGFDPQLSGRDNAILSGLLMGLELEQAKHNIHAIIEFSELEGFIDRQVKTYSSGMRARLGFSIALHLQPDLLLIDEVLGVGDAEFRKKSSQAMRDKIKSNQTVVLVSHNAQVMKQLCGRVVWVEEGVTRMIGPSADVVDTYEEYVTCPAS